MAKKRDLEGWSCQDQLDLTELVDEEHISGAVHASDTCPDCGYPLMRDRSCFICEWKPIWKAKEE